MRSPRFRLLAFATAVSASLLLPTLSLAQSKGGGDDPPVALTLAVADSDRFETRPIADFLVDLVAELSGGDMAIVPTFDAGGDDFEAGTIGLVRQGAFDLAMVGGRAWVAAGVPRMEALHAPLLVDDTALAVELARGDVAERSLGALRAGGVVGLALWPETLRYFFAYPSFGRPILSPTDLAGSVIKADPGTTGQLFVEALGGTVWTGDGLEHDVDTGLIQGADSNLRGRGLALATPTATGNVVLYPKYQTLVANEAACEDLTSDQQDVLRQAATEARDLGLSLVADERILAAEWCAGDGAVMLTGPEQVQAFRVAAESVWDTLREDELTDELIDRIIAIKTAATPSPGVSACSSDDGLVLIPATDTTGYLGTLPPDGSYRAAATVEELVARGMSEPYARANAGTSTWTFQDGTVTLQARNADGIHECQASTAPAPDGRSMILTDLPGGTCGIGVQLAWQPTSDGIRLLMVVPPGLRGTPGMLQDFMDFKAGLEGIEWVRIG